jgi:hypothetical protein
MVEIIGSASSYRDDIPHISGSQGINGYRPSTQVPATHRVRLIFLEDSIPIKQIAVLFTAAEILIIKYLSAFYIILIFIYRGLPE